MNLWKKYVIQILFACIFHNHAFAENCTSVIMSTMDYGNVVMDGSTIDTTSTMTIFCDGMHTNSYYDFCISIGSGSVYSGSSRQLGNGGNVINQEFYSDAGRTNKWGSYETGWAGGGVTITRGTGTNPTLNFSVPVYGRILSGQQSKPSGSYSSNFAAAPFIRWDEDPSYGGDPCITSSKVISTSFTAIANVIGSCTVATTNMNFGVVNFLNNNIDAIATISPTCSINAPYSVSLSNGNTGTGPTNRKMVNGGNSVTYGLYQNASRSQPWGNIIGTNTVGGTGNGSAQPITVYGRVPPQTTPPPATYTDTVVVTVTY
jgi:spore coat protein U-like protein